MKGPTNSHKPLSPEQNSGVALPVSVAIAGMVHVHIVDARFGPHRIGMLRHAARGSPRHGVEPRGRRTWTRTGRRRPGQQRLLRTIASSHPRLAPVPPWAFVAVFISHACEQSEKQSRPCLPRIGRSEPRSHAGLYSRRCLACTPASGRRSVPSSRDA